MGMNRRTWGSRGTVRPLARKMLMLLFTATNSGKEDSKLQVVPSERAVWVYFCRQKALVSVNTASVNTKIYWLAEEEQKISFILLWQICLALESAMQIINSTDGRPKENPRASLKHTAWSIFFNHQWKLMEIQCNKKWWDLQVHQGSPLHSWPTSYFLCIGALQAQSNPGEGEGKGSLVVLQTRQILLFK